MSFGYAECKSNKHEPRARTKSTNLEHKPRAQT